MIYSYKVKRRNLTDTAHGLPLRAGAFTLPVDQETVAQALAREAAMDDPTADPAVRRSQICTAPMMAVLPLGHPLAKKSRLEPADFHDQAFVALGADLGAHEDFHADRAVRGVLDIVLEDDEAVVVLVVLVGIGGGAQGDIGCLRHSRDRQCAGEQQGLEHGLEHSGSSRFLKLVDEARKARDR